MNNDRWSGTGSFHPQRAWSEIRRKDWERKHEAGSRGGGWLALALLACALLVVVCVGGFLLGLPKLLGNFL